MKNFPIVLLLAFNAATASSGGTHDTASTTTPVEWGRRIAASYLLRHPNAVTYDAGLPDDKWTYEQGLMLEAFRHMWVSTGDSACLDFIRKNVDHYVGETGTIRTYKQNDFNLDNIAGGRALLFLYRQTNMEKYRAAALSLRGQLQRQPRTHEGGFWHKKVYPFQMWLDGLYMAEPFYAHYAGMFNEPAVFDDVADQFVWMYRHARDSVTGLCTHGWDESRAQRWADTSTGRSPAFWGRAMGWYVMGLVDVLDVLPVDHPRRNELIGILKELSAAVLRFRDRETGLWYQVVDQGGRPGNYAESSASAMFTYAFAKGANKGYLDALYAAAARESFEAITKHFLSVDAKGLVHLGETCAATGLGGTPYRDGSYNYYVGIPRVEDDPRGIGPFLLAAMELGTGPPANGGRK